MPNPPPNPITVKSLADIQSNTAIITDGIDFSNTTPTTTIYPAVKSLTVNSGTITYGSTIATLFPNLESLTIGGDSLSTVTLGTNSFRYRLFPNLKTLIIKNTLIPGAVFFNPDTINDQIKNGKSSFPLLETLEISFADLSLLELKNVPQAILDFLKEYGTTMVGIDNIGLPKLTTLRLKNINLYSGNFSNALEFPELKNLEISGAKKSITVPKVSVTQGLIADFVFYKQNFANLENLSFTNMTIRSSAFINVKFPKLSSLSFNECNFSAHSFKDCSFALAQTKVTNVKNDVNGPLDCAAFEGSTFNTKACVTSTTKDLPLTLSKVNDSCVCMHIKHIEHLIIQR